MELEDENRGFMNVAEVNKEKTKEYEKLTKQVADLSNEVKRLNGVMEKIANPSFKQTIENNDRNLLEKVCQSLNETAGSLKMLLIIVAVAFVLDVGMNMYSSYNHNKAIDQVSTDYDYMTSILSGDRHYWFDGENYQLSRQAPETKRLEEAARNYAKNHQK